MYPSFLYAYIIPHFPVFVKYFCEKVEKFFAPGHGALAPNATSGEFGYTVGVVLAVGEYPTRGRARQTMSRKPFAVIGVVTLDPTL